MKKIINLSILVSIFFFVVTYSEPGNAQVCQADLVLSSQAQVDAFNCTEVNGNIIISGADITNLNALTLLTKVVGRLSIVDNPNLASLNGLSGLRSVDDFLAIALNPLLASVSGLSALEQVGGLAISTNNTLRDLDGFESLGGITKAGLSINDNPELADISGLDMLHTVNGGVSIINNGGLQAIKTFNNLRTLSEIWIWSNGNILEIDGFNSLLSVQELSIQWSSALSTIHGFSALTNAHNIQINGNPKLSAIGGFASLRSISGNVFLTEDLELANIGAFSNLDSIRGELRILNAGKLVDMSSLSSLKYAGSIKLSNNNNLRNINGLTSLTELGSGDGSALVRGIAYALEVSSNDMLTNLDGLSSLTRASGPIRIFSNSTLQSIDGFSSVRQIKGSVDINNNSSLKSLDGFNQLEDITEYPLFGECGLVVDKNVLLSEFTGLSALKGLTGGQPLLQISNNNSLENIDALSNLTTVTGIAPTISIVNNSSLKNIDGLASLSNVTDKELFLVINNNATLENIDGLASLGKEVQDTPLSIIVTQNAALTRCDGLLPYFISLGVDEVLNLNASGRIQVNENGAGCTVQDILSGGGIVVQICEGEIVLAHQAEIDAFTCREVRGNLRISGTDITNLNGLSSLEKITGNFWIADVSNLLTLDGLSALDTVGGALSIVDNLALTSIDGLSSLKSAASLNVIGNSSLTNLDGMTALTEIRNGGMYISNNASLRDISGPSLLREINGGVTIETNNNLTNISGFDNLVMLHAITISGNPKLGEIRGFNSLATIQNDLPGNLIIEGNNSLNSVEGFLALMNVNSIQIVGNNLLSKLDPFVALKSLSGDLLLSDNSALSAIDGFNSVDSIVGDVRIENNGALKDLTGFASLKSAGNLFIRNNPNLIYLGGFLSLTKLYTGDFNDGQLLVEFNENLTSISAFNKLMQVSAVSIYDNTKLVSVKGFTSLAAIKNTPGEAQGLPGVLSIGLNDELTDIQGFSRLSYVGSLSLYGNNSLVNINAFSSLDRLGAGGLSISNNAVLENLDGLSSLDEIFSVTGGPIPVIVTQNPSLNNCCGLRPLLETLGVTEPNFYIEITENGSGCTVEDILACGPQKVSKFTIIDRRTGQEVYPLENDSITLDMANPDFRYWALQAITSPEEVGSVEFKLGHKISHTENIFPYIFELPRHLRSGAHTVVAKVYSESDRNGEEGIGRTATITIIKSSAVVSYHMVNVHGKFMRRLNEGDIIDLYELKSKGQTIVANTTGWIGSVKFDVNNRFFNIQNVFPYTLTGDLYGIYFKPWIPEAGFYTLTATPYARSNAGGKAGKSLTIHFTVVDKNDAIAGRMGTTGLEENGLNSDLIIYPVPVDNELFVKMDDTIGDDAVLTILTMQGLSVYEGYYSKASSISTSGLRPGVYILVVRNNGFQRMRKFIKK